MTSDTSRELTPTRVVILSPSSRCPPTEWQEAAFCRQADPELFFPIGSSGPAAVQTERAKAVCARCPVRRACLGYALTTGQEFGIWGGLDENERRVLRRQQRRLRRRTLAGLPGAGGFP